MVNGVRMETRESMDRQSDETLRLINSRRSNRRAERIARILFQTNQGLLMGVNFGLMIASIFSITYQLRDPKIYIYFCAIFIFISLWGMISAYGRHRNSLIIYATFSIGVLITVVFFEVIHLSVHILVVLILGAMCPTLALSMACQLAPANSLCHGRGMACDGHYHHRHSINYGIL